ncbi:MAG: hypothetical protein WDM79_02705 [Terricaulis sp.]
MNDQIGSPDTYRTPLGQRLGVAFALALIAPLALGVGVAAFVVMRMDLGGGIVMAVVALFCAALAVYVGRDALAKWGMFARFGAAAVELRLPPFRSHIHHPPRSTVRLLTPISRRSRRGLRLIDHGRGGDAARLCFAPPEPVEKVATILSARSLPSA